MSRAWVHNRIKTGNASLTTLHGNRVFTTTSLEKAPDTKPFIIHRSLAERPDLRGDDSGQTRRDTYLIFVHDVPGDYLQIDTMVAYLIALFEDHRDPDNNIIRTSWIETSEDFRDDDMGTILKYVRIDVLVRT